MRYDSNRDYTLDLACGILIIRMVLRHVLQWSQVTHYDIYEWLNIFFYIMPWFYFKSGMFYKDQPTRVVCEKGWNHLIKPLLLLSLVGHVIICIGYAVKGGHRLYDYLLEPFVELFTYGSIQGNLALWFLLSLFIVRCLYNILSSRIRLNAIFILLTSLIVTLLIFHFEIHKPYYLANSLAGLFFFSAGRLLAKLQYNKWIMGLSAIVFLIHMIFLPSFVDMRVNKLVEGYYELWLIGSISGCILLNGLCRMAFLYIPRLINKNPRLHYLDFIPNFIITLGRNSLIIYLYHWLFLLTFSICFYDLPYFNGHHRWMYFTLSSIFTAIGLFVIYKYKNSKIIKFLTCS